MEHVPPNVTVLIPVTEAEVVGLRLRRPWDKPRLRVHARPDGALLLKADEADRWALIQLYAWRHGG